MKRFQFKLQALLTLRQRAEKLVLEEYAHSLHQRNQAALLLAQAEAQLQQVWEEWHREIADPNRAVRLTRIMDYCQFADVRRSQCQSGLVSAELAVSRTIEKLLATRQQREAVENLLDIQRHRYAQQCQRAEQKLIDDLVNSRRGSYPAGEMPNSDQSLN